MENSCFIGIELNYRFSHLGRVLDTASAFQAHPGNTLDSHNGLRIEDWLKNIGGHTCARSAVFLIDLDIYCIVGLLGGFSK